MKPHLIWARIIFLTTLASYCTIYFEGKGDQWSMFLFQYILMLSFNPPFLIGIIQIVALVLLGKCYFLEFRTSLKLTLFYILSQIGLLIPFIFIFSSSNLNQLLSDIQSILSFCIFCIATVLGIFFFIKYCRNNEKYKQSTNEKLGSIEL